MSGLLLFYTNWIKLRHDISIFRMVKGVWHIDGEKPGGFVGLVHPIMRFVGMDLNAVAGIERVLGGVQVECYDSFQDINELFSGVAVHFQIFLISICEGKKGKNAGKKIKCRDIMA